MKCKTGSQRKTVMDEVPAGTASALALLAI